MCQSTFPESRPFLSHLCHTERQLTTSGSSIQLETGNNSKSSFILRQLKQLEKTELYKGVLINPQPDLLPNVVGWNR